MDISAEKTTLDQALHGLVSQGRTGRSNLCMRCATGGSRQCIMRCICTRCSSGCPEA